MSFGSVDGLFVEIYEQLKLLSAIPYLLYPNLYADGYIAIAFHICLFVCSDVHLFVRSPLLSSMVVELRQSFALSS